MKKYLVFNFKNNPVLIQDLRKLIQVYDKYLNNLNNKYQIVLIPPNFYLLPFKEELKIKVSYGIQNIFWLDKIAITGEITPQMAISLGIKYVIIGHSERKLYLKEEYDIINNKIKASLAHRLIPIICVGEKERRDNIDFSVKEEIFDELNYSLRGINLKSNDKIIIAYEPFWAVNKGVTPSLEKIEEMIKLIKFWLSRRFQEEIGKKIPILYGGSVDAKNINEILSLKSINGVLIGGKSGKPQQIDLILKKIQTNK